MSFGDSFSFSDNNLEGLKINVLNLQFSKLCSELLDSAEWIDEEETFF